MALRMRRNSGPTPPEPCMLTECMAVIAGARAPNVIWSLRAGPRRFSDLRADIPPVTSKVLSTRLSELEARGAELIPALEAIVDVGHRLTARRADALSAADRSPRQAEAR